MPRSVGLAPRHIWVATAPARMCSSRASYSRLSRNNIYSAMRRLLLSSAAAVATDPARAADASRGFGGCGQCRWGVGACCTALAPPWSSGAALAGRGRVTAGGWPSPPPCLDRCRCRYLASGTWQDNGGRVLSHTSRKKLLSCCLSAIATTFSFARQSPSPHLGRWL